MGPGGCSGEKLEQQVGGNFIHWNFHDNKTNRCSIESRSRFDRMWHLTGCIVWLARLGISDIPT